MSLTGMMRTSISGMAAQANRLGTVSDNIANSSTTGYKRASTEFSSLILSSGSADYVPGGVETSIRYGISQQGAFQFTTSVTDLAVSGDGFFVVSDPERNALPDARRLLRAGRRGQPRQRRRLQAHGLRLATAVRATVVANGFAGLAPVNIGQLALQADPSDAGNLYVNLPSTATAVGPLDAAIRTTHATAEYTAKTSLVAYDNLGDEVTLDVYYTKTGANAWEVAVFDRADAAPGGGFPYTCGADHQRDADLQRDDRAAHQHAGGAVDSPCRAAPPSLSISRRRASSPPTTRCRDVQVNGNAPSAVERVEIDDDGILYAVYENGARAPTFRIPLARRDEPGQPAAAGGQRLCAQPRTSAMCRWALPGQSGLRHRWCRARSRSRPSTSPPSSPR